jgi:hypothetical protein
VNENSNAAYLDETLSESTSAFADHASVTNRIRVQDVIDSYQISQTLLKGRYPRWSTINSDAQMTAPDASVANRVRTLAAESESSGMFESLMNSTEKDGKKRGPEKKRD